MDGIWKEKRGFLTAPGLCGLVLLLAILQYSSMQLLNNPLLEGVQCLLVVTSLGCVLSRNLVVAVSFLLISLSFGLIALIVDRQELWSWRFLQYFLVHIVWLFVVAFWLGRIHGQYMVAIFRFAVFSFFVWLILGGASVLDRYHQDVLFLQVLIILLATMVFKRSLIPAGLFLVWLAAIVAVQLVSGHLVEADGAVSPSYWRGFELVGHMLFAACLFVWFIEDSEAVRWIFSALVLAVFIYLSVVSVLWEGLADPAAYNWFHFPPLFHHIRHLGYLLCMAVVFFAWAVLAWQGKIRLLAWSAYVVAFGLLLWSGGRGSFIAVMAGVGYLLLVGRRGYSLKMAVCLFIGFLIALFLSALFPVDDPGMGWLSAIARSEAAESINNLSTGRLDIWRELSGRLLERPWFGWGGDAVRQLMPGRGIVQAHNGILQIGIEWGVVGLLVIGGGMLFLLGRFPVPLNGQCSIGERLLGGVLAVSLFVLSMMDGVLFHALPLVFLAMSYALLAARAPSRFEERNELPGKCGEC